MGQQDILDLLKSNPNRWYTARHLSTILDVGLSSICYPLMKLRDHEDIQTRKRPHGKKRRLTYEYKSVKKV